MSVARIGLIPLFLWVLFGADNPVAAGWLLGLIGATDWVDGFLARKLDQVSELGKMLDPVADRGAIAAAVIGGLISGDIPAIFAVALIVREALMALVTLYVVLRARTKLAVRYGGKVATAGLYTAVALFFVHGNVGFWESVAWALGVPALVLYYAVAAQYVGDARHAVAGPPPAV